MHQVMLSELEQRLARLEAHLECPHCHGTGRITSVSGVRDAEQVRAGMTQFSDLILISRHDFRPRRDLIKERYISEDVAEISFYVTDTDVTLAVCGMWVPGLYDSREAAAAAIDVHPADLHQKWFGDLKAYGTRPPFSLAEVLAIRGDE